MQVTNINLATILSMTEEQARDMLEAIRWPNGVTCAHCGSDHVTHLEGSKHRPGVYQCNTCREQFTVTVGTVLHRSRLPLTKWIAAFFLLCTSKKGVSALQLKRQLGIGSYQTAWHLAHRIRLAMTEGPLSELMGQNGGTVEADETYVGGKPRKGGAPRKRGRGSPKTPVFVLVDREGRAYSKPVKRVNGTTLKGAIKEMVDSSARICTDEFGAYVGLDKDFDGGHHVVRHSASEYSRGDVHVNFAESYFSLFKRGIMGSFHHVSKRHLHRYCDEFSFRWSHRKEPDGLRTVIAIMGAEGKRLTYKSPVGVN